MGRAHVEEFLKQASPITNPKNLTDQRQESLLGTI